MIGRNFSVTSIPSSMNFSEFVKDSICQYPSTTVAIRYSSFILIERRKREYGWNCWRIISRLLYASASSR